MPNNVDTENFDSTIDCFEDEIDYAIMCDPKFEEALADMASKQPTVEEERYDDDCDDEDYIDTDMDYYESTPSADIVDMDADDLLAAERDIAHDPFEDDEIIDIAIGDDDIEIDDLDDED